MISSRKKRQFNSLGNDWLLKMVNITTRCRPRPRKHLLTRPSLRLKLAIINQRPHIQNSKWTQETKPSVLAVILRVSNNNITCQLDYSLNNTRLNNSNLQWMSSRHLFNIGNINLIRSLITHSATIQTKLKMSLHKLKGRQSLWSHVVEEDLRWAQIHPARRKNDLEVRASK